MDLDLSDDAAIRRLLESRQGLPLLALATASESLYQAYSAIPRDQPMPSQVKRKIIRFVIRMCSRPTPFGILAGVALAVFNGTTSVALSGTLRRRTRPDMGWIHQLIKHLSTKCSLVRYQRFISNPGLRIGGDRLYLAKGEATASGGGQSEVSIRLTGPVREVLTHTQSPAPYELLMDGLLSHAGANYEKVERLIESLVSQGFLIGDLNPSLDQESPARALSQKLQEIPELADTAREFCSTLDAIRHWDGVDYTDALNQLKSIRAQATKILPDESNHLFQVDTAIDVVTAKLSSAIGEEAAKCASILLRCTSLPKGTAQLAEYRDRFLEKFSIGQEILIQDLLDPDLGLGPLRQDVVAAKQESLVQRRDRKLLELATHALWRREREIVLGESTVSELTTWVDAQTSLPPSLDVIFSIAAKSQTAIDSGDFTLVVSPNVGATAGGRYLARFSDLLGTEAVQHLNDLARAEEEAVDGAIVAELLFAPTAARIANVLIRPNCRKFCIPVDCHPGDNAYEIIPLQEIVVGVRNGRFYIKWTRRDTELRISNLHMLNLTLSNELCRLLTELSSDGMPRLGGFDWGPAQSFPYLPRVRYHKSVLRTAEWRIRAGVWESAFGTSTESFAEAFRRYRLDWSVPRLVYLVDADHRLLLDLDSEECVEELREELKRRAIGNSTVALQEVFPAPDDMWVSAPSGRHASELVVSLVRDRSARESPDSRASALVAPRVIQRDPFSRRERLRHPGSEWIYVKLYSSKRVCVPLLCTSIPEVIELLTDRGLIASWFFLRYADPDPHIRLRIRLLNGIDPPEAMAVILSWVCGVSGRNDIGRIAIDTYEREIERYGGMEGMAVAEELFGLDSETTIRCLQYLRDGHRDIDLIDVTTLSLHSYLRGIGLSSGDTLRLLQTVPMSRAKAGLEYRTRGRRLLKAIRAMESGNGGAASEELEWLVRCYDERGLSQRRRLDQLVEDGQLAVELPEIWSSLAHMHCNRMLGVDQETELLVYGLLARMLESLTFTK